MVFAYQPTGSWFFEKPPQFVENTTEGVPPASSTFALLGNVIDLNPQLMVGKSIDDGLGARDIISQTGLTEKYSASIRWKPQTSLAYAKYGFNLPNEGTPAGTNAADTTLVWSQLVDGTEKFYALVGIKIDKTSIEISKDGGVVIGQDVKALDYLFEADDLDDIGITTPTYINAVPSTPTMTSKSGGLEPLSIDGSPRETNRFKVDINHNVQELDLNGPSTVQHLGAARRRIQIDFDTVYRDPTFHNAYKNQTQHDIEYIIYNAVSPPIKMSFIDCQLDQCRRTIQGTSNNFDMESVIATPISGTLTG